ncbi:MAG: isoprenyl transferase [Planctomycetaceae bacterium]|nr:MAG: isoprenyl transferase [Planctomycetaceae bacterium]
MADVSPNAVAAARRSLGVPEEQIPKSVAVIMDGNGRWARSRGLPRPAGHVAGSKIVRPIVSEAARLGLSALTLYSFSLENWSRPSDEVNCLMHLYADCLVSERPTIMEHNVRLRHLGRREGLPDIVLRELDKSVEVSASNTGMYLCLALNYSSRAEIIDAVRRIAGKVETGQLSPDKIDEAVINNSLDTAGVPDPDLLMRTAGEMRISNFLLWQISYAELYVTDVFWPDFDEAEFRKGITAYANRHRRFGGLDDSNS